MNYFDADRRERLLDVFVGAFVVVCAGIIALWIVTALVVGSIDIARWLEGLT